MVVVADLVLVGVAERAGSRAAESGMFVGQRHAAVGGEGVVELRRGRAGTCARVVPDDVDAARWGRRTACRTTARRGCRSGSSLTRTDGSRSAPPSVLRMKCTSSGSPSRRVSTEHSTYTLPRVGRSERSTATHDLTEQAAGVRDAACEIRAAQHDDARVDSKAGATSGFLRSSSARRRTCVKRSARRPPRRRAVESDVTVPKIGRLRDIDRRREGRAAVGGSRERVVAAAAGVHAPGAVEVAVADAPVVRSTAIHALSPPKAGSGRPQVAPPSSETEEVDR